MCSPEVRQLRTIVEYCMDSRLAGRPVLKPSRFIAECNYIYSIENNDLLQWINEGNL